MEGFYDRVCGEGTMCLNSHVGSTMENAHYNDSVFEEFVRGKPLFYNRDVATPNEELEPVVL